MGAIFQAPFCASNTRVRTCASSLSVLLTAPIRNCSTRQAPDLSVALNPNQHDTYVQMRRNKHRRYWLTPQNVIRSAEWPCGWYVPCSSPSPEWVNMLSLLMKASFAASCHLVAFPPVGGRRRVLAGIAFSRRLASTTHTSLVVCCLFVTSLCTLRRR